MKIDKDGVTHREVLEGLMNRTRRADKRAEYEKKLYCPPRPPALAYLWKVFHRLSRRVGSGFGPSPIGWVDIDAFVRLSGLSLAPWEIELIEDLDNLRLASEGTDISSDE